MREQTVTNFPTIEGAIRNPNNPNHFMVVKPVERRIRIYLDDLLLADSNSALRVIEIGKSVYHPALYIPQNDLKTSFQSIDKKTHCPLKGDASYYTLNQDEIAWSYTTPFDFAAVLSGHYSFWASKVCIVEGE